MSRSLIEIEDEKRYNTPEKWYVRKEWLEHARIRKQRNSRDFLRLLTLTCIRAYDIKFFEDAGLILRTATGYDPRSVAFCEKEGHRATLIRNTLPGARYYQGPFEGLVGAGMVRFSSKVDEWFPFDVVNLDVNQPILKRDSTFLSAIQKLFMAQKLKKQSFSLFLTICSIEAADDNSKKNELREHLEKNLEIEDFRKIFHEKHPNGRFTSYHEFQSVTVSKLIIDYGLDMGFDAQCKEKLTYIGEELTTRMVSFIFDCEYLELVNSTIITSEIRPQRMLNIIETDCEDVNQILERNPQVRKDCLELRDRYIEDRGFT